MGKYKNLIFAGTFDHLHIGHKQMLEKAFEIADHVSIGIATEKLYRTKPLANLIPTWQVRKGLVEQFLRGKNWLKKADFFRLDDIYGPAIKEGRYDSLLVSHETKKNALKINQMRRSKDLVELKIVSVPFVMGSDKEPVTSERIRMGEIDSDGMQYKLTDKKTKKQLVLPESLREELRKPLGKVIDGLEIDLEKTARRLIESLKKTNHTMVISVGDIVSSSLLKAGYDPDVKIVDLRSRRKLIDELTILRKKKSRHFNYVKVVNEPGTITMKASHAIEDAIRTFFASRKKQVVVVAGEEDLLALPAILFAPLGSLVLYGQWNLGVVMVEVSEEKKKEIEKILKKFV